MGMLKRQHQALVELMDAQISHLIPPEHLPKACSCENAQYY